MNVSHRHKTIWWAPERTGTKITREILQNYNFLIFDSKTDKEVPMEERSVSHLNRISEEYSDYTLISNIRNPYDRVFSIFLTTFYENIALEKKLHDEIRKTFNCWVSNAFTAQKMSVKLDTNYSAKNIDLNYFSKWVFNEKKPDFLIRMENLVEDLEKLDFVKSDSNWDSLKIQQIVGNNVFKNNRPVKFNKMYDFDSAKLIYIYFKSVFNLVPYDPFSFTTENLSESEKISFLHDIL
jgi:hypothetical protein